MTLGIVKLYNIYINEKMSENIYGCNVFKMKF